MADSKLPISVSLWILFSSIICTLDAWYVLNRPRTLPGGDLNYVLPQYNTAIEVDTRYKDLKDGFLIGESWMNVVELVINLFVLILSAQSSILTPVVAIIASTMTCSKTVLYFLMSTKLCYGDELIKTTSWSQYMFMFVLPTVVWIVVPLLCMISLSSQITRLIHDGHSKHKTN